MSINVLKFEPRYRTVKGQAVREDWVQIAPKHSPNAITNYKVRHITPPEDFADNQSAKAQHMRAIWSIVGPAYEAWLKGEDIPEDGYPLSAWPGCNDAQVHELRKHGIRTVEDVRDMSDGQVPKINLPDVRLLRSQARLFLEAQESTETARRMAEQEAQMATMHEQMEEMRAALAAAQEKPKRGRPRKQTEDA